MTEQWNPVVGYEGSYEVSDLGNVRSLDRWRRNRQSLYLVKGRPVTQHELRFGHYCVYLYQLGVKRHKRWLTHRLVLTAFVGPCPDGHEGCHKDGDPTNNRLGNLYWGSHAENMQDSVRHGRHNSRFKAELTRCKWDHEFTPENTYITRDGWRMCRTCVNDRIRRYRREGRLGTRKAKAA